MVYKMVEILNQNNIYILKQNNNKYIYKLKEGKREKIIILIHFL